MRNDPRNVLPQRIETPRLILRAPMRADVAELAHLANNKALAQVLTRLPHPYTRADAIGFIEIVAQRQSERAYAVTLKTGAFIGCVGIHFHPGTEPELGYWLGEPFWGRGFGTEAAWALVAAARATGQFPALAARALASNGASRRVLEKLGFRLLAEGLAAEGPHQGKPVADYRLEVTP